MRQLPQTGGWRNRALWLTCAVWLFALCLAPSRCSARIPETCAIVRPQDEVWLVSTREMGSLPQSSLLCNPCFTYQRYCCECGWAKKSAADFQNCYDPRAVTIIYVHGNRMTTEWAQRRGLDLYNGLKCCPDDRPIRLVIWSWPSSPIPRRAAFLRDARVKLRRTPLQSYYLGWWLTNCCNDCRVSLLGFSYGGHTILGALQLMGGGSLAGRCLPSRCCRHAPRVRIALWAAATQADWLLPGRPHGQALGCVERGVIFYNRFDPALKRFSRLSCAVTGPALGYSGLTHPCCGPAAYSRFVQYDVTNTIGRHHEWDRFRNCAWTMNRIRQLALSWEPCSPIEAQKLQIQRVASLAPIIGRLH